MKHSGALSPDRVKMLTLLDRRVKMVEAEHKPSIQEAMRLPKELKW